MDTLRLPKVDPNIKPGNQEAVSHESLSNSQDLDRLPHDKLEKKYRPCIFFQLRMKLPG